MYYDRVFGIALYFTAVVRLRDTRNAAGLINNNGVVPNEGLEQELNPPPPVIQTSAITIKLPRQLNYPGPPFLSS